MNISLLSRSILSLNLLCHGWAKIWLIKTKYGTNDNNEDDSDVNKAGSGFEYGLDYEEYEDYVIYEDYMDYTDYKDDSCGALRAPRPLNTDYMEGQSQSDSQISKIIKSNKRCLRMRNCVLSPYPPECGNDQVWNQDRIRCVSPKGAPQQHKSSFPIKTFCQHALRVGSYCWNNWRGICMKISYIQSHGK